MKQKGDAWRFVTEQDMSAWRFVAEHDADVCNEAGC